ncbi:NAD(P)/FAD-dependent oxidoreductase [Entomospira nematocerorum]|uniref:NAD(P)/FAD-dependent oxidoreductase n=1 Tax=Entomospira nematocerorum TaxID=2719987 RepID=A0A968KSG9_9SPIO|nr:NAD(P)/FAD-dependent oxidoreductase [Entomospira nematocera]NIZ46441.1 NAD(P)/FAD-dependent oxidoreductase [Entomospira nematocera]WDI33756.1 NAD(P)/FAD-dependent oxidoreductase [Entomospira nematocera]
MTQNTMIDNFDIAVIGSGPAGLAAAINLKIRNKRFILLGYPQLSHQVEVSVLIDNLLGFPNIKGSDLNKAWKNHLEAMDIRIVDDRVRQVYTNVFDEKHVVACRNGDYIVRSVIIAAGIIRNNLIPGESELLGQGGVSYCATCDGMFYKGKKVVIFGTTEDAVHEAEYLCEVASEVVFIASAKVKGTVSASNCTQMRGKPVKILSENGKFTAVEMFDGTQIEGAALFIIKDAAGPSYLVPGIEAENDSIHVDADMRTNIRGIFAAGDCTGKPWQLMRAMGQGQIAALNSVRYLDEENYWSGL